MTVAAFMDVALYHREFGYYARAAQRSGRAGDFFTSVDVGPLFGELLAVQVADMARLLSAGTAAASPPEAPDALFNLVEAGAGNGRLSRDILASLEREAPDVYARTRLHLVEASARARDEHRETLGASVACLSTSAETAPLAFEGVLLANELLDAMPVHQVVMRSEGLREVYVDWSGGTLISREGAPSTPRLAAHFEALGLTLEPGWRAEVSLAAIDWVRDVVGRLTRGFLILIDYGHEAHELYGVAHSGGTLTTYSRHRSEGAEAPSAALPWLQRPGEQDLTAHVDFTSISRAAEARGCTKLGLLDQTYFLMALAARRFDALDLKQRLALKTLVMPGGLGSTMKVLILGKDVGSPALAGCAGRGRLT